MSHTKLPHGEVRTVQSAAQHPQLLARDMIVTAVTPVGKVPTFRFALAEPDRVRHITDLGEDTDVVLTEASYDAERIANLRAGGVIR